MGKSGSESLCESWLGATPVIPVLGDASWRIKSSRSLLHIHGQLKVCEAIKRKERNANIGSHFQYSETLLTLSQHLINTNL